VDVVWFSLSKHVIAVLIVELWLDIFYSSAERIMADGVIFLFC